MHQIVPVNKKSLCHSLEFTKPPIIILSHKAELMLSVHRFLLPCCHVLPFQSPLFFSLSLFLTNAQQNCFHIHSNNIKKTKKRDLMIVLVYCWLQIKQQQNEISYFKILPCFYLLCQTFHVCNYQQQWITK